MQLKSVQLTLMMGPVIPVTVPRVVLDSLAEVEVKVEDVGASGFQLVFSSNRGTNTAQYALQQSTSREVFQRYGLMDHGSVWGHGTLRGMDFSAHTLHCVGDAR